MEEKCWRRERRAESHRTEEKKSARSLRSRENMVGKKFLKIIGRERLKAKNKKRKRRA